MDIGQVKGSIGLDLGPLREGAAASVTVAKGLAGTLTDTLGKPFAGAATETGKLTSSLGGMATAVGQVAGQGRSAASAVSSLVSAASNSSLGGMFSNAAGAASSLVGQSHAVHSVLSSILTTAAGTALSSMFTSTLGAAASFVGTLEGIGVESIKVAAQAESTALALRTMIGNADVAGALLLDLRTFANTTPFQFGELSVAAKQLLAMGVNAKDVVGTLRMIGDVSSGLNQPIGEMAYLFGQAKSRGELSSIELREFAMRGVPIFDQLAKVLNTNVAGVRKLGEEGRLSFRDLEAAFRSMTSEGGKFFEMTAQQSQTAAGLYSTLEDAVADVERQIGEALTSGSDGKSLLKEITAEITKLTPSMVQLGVSLAEAFKNALPYIRTAGDYFQVILDKVGLIDLNKINGNPYQSATPKQEDAVRGAGASADTDAKLFRIQGGVSQGIKDAAAQLKGIGDFDHSGDDAGKRVEDYSAKLAAVATQSDAAMAKFRQMRSGGAAVTQEQYQRAKDEVAAAL